MLNSGQQMKLGIIRVPLGRSALIAQVAIDEESIARAADPRAGRADVHVAEEVVGGIGDERAVLRVRAGEGDCRGSVFEGAVVSDVAGEDGGGVGDTDLMSGGIDDVAVDGAGAAAEGHAAVVGELGGAKGSVAGDLAGAGQWEAVVVESSAGEVDDAGVGSKAAADQHLVGV